MVCGALSNQGAYYLTSSPRPGYDAEKCAGRHVSEAGRTITGTGLDWENSDMTKDELIRYVAERFSADAEYPWADENFVFRHQSNRKWFAVAMSVPYSRLGIDREGFADIVDVKTGPLLMDAYRAQHGILPGYHMNKDHWVTILLDGSADDDLIRELFEISYDLTK